MDGPVERPLDVPEGRHLEVAVCLRSLGMAEGGARYAGGRQYLWTWIKRLKWPSNCKSHEFYLSLVFGGRGLGTRITATLKSSSLIRFSHSVGPLSNNNATSSPLER